MTAAHTVTTVTADSVDLIDKDDARRVLLGLLKHVTNTACTNAHEHFNKVGTGNSEERYLGLTRNRLGDQGFTRTWRTHHQYAARDTPAQTLELARIAQELNQLAHFFLGFIATCHVSQGRLDLVFRQQPRLALAKAHRAAFTAGTALHLAHHEHEDRNNHQDREARNQQLGPDALLLRQFAFNGDVVIHQVADQTVVLNGRTDGFEGIAIAAFAGNHVAIHGNALDLAILNLLDEVGIVEGLWLVWTGEVVHHCHQDSGDDQPQDQILCHIVQLATL